MEGDLSPSKRTAIALKPGIRQAGPGEAEPVTVFVGGREDLDVFRQALDGNKRPLIRQAGSAVGLYGFCCHWQRTAFDIGPSTQDCNREISRIPSTRQPPRFTRKPPLEHP
jgi:hypothetical protein